MVVLGGGAVSYKRGTPVSGRMKGRRKGRRRKGRRKGEEKGGGGRKEEAEWEGSVRVQGLGFRV